MLFERFQDFGSSKSIAVIGAWRSLVARTVRDREVGGSNPLAPTNFPRWRKARVREKVFPPMAAPASYSIKRAGVLPKVCFLVFLSPQARQTP